MATKGYQSYHGRTPGWKKLLIVILLLILIAAGVFLVLQNYQVFDGNGMHFRPPWSAQQQNEPSSEEEENLDDEDVVVNIQEPASSTQELHGRTFAAETLQAETFAALQEGERPVLTMKPANGTLLIGDSAAADMVRQKIASRDAVARISCFADTKKADSDNSMAVMSVSGKAWRDPDGNAWLDPYNPAVTTYLLDAVQSCVDAGFTEIVLDDVQFPNYGRLDRITYGDAANTPQTRTQAICAFLDAVNEALADTDVTVSICLPDTLLENTTDEDAGWDLSAIAQRVDRIYMDVSDQAAADAARTALGALRTDAEPNVFFVAQTTAPITGGSYVIMP